MKDQKVKGTAEAVQKIREITLKSQGKQSKFLELLSDNTPEMEKEERDVKINLPSGIWKLIDEDAEKSRMIGEETEAGVEVNAIISLVVASSGYGRRDMEQKQEEAPRIIHPRDN